MDRVDYTVVYEAPKEYLPPNDVDLSSDQNYPNLNTRDYRRRKLDRTLKHNQFFEVLTSNDENLVILVTNDLRGRVWTANFWGYENLNNFSEETACFKQLCRSTVTGLKFLNSERFVEGELNGTLNLWSTRNQSETSGFNLSSIAVKTEHLGGITCLEVLLPDKTKVATGSNDCFLNVWDTGESDLNLISSLRYAHSDNITSISASPCSSDVFATCSKDKSALFWDYRLPKPAKVLFKNNPVGFSTIMWGDQKQSEEKILLGDESGILSEIDIKMPQKVLNRVNVFDKPLRKISRRGSKTAVIGNTNLVRVYNTNYETCYENSVALDYVRDLYWDSEESFFTVGWDKALRHHLLKSKE